MADGSDQLAQALLLDGDERLQPVSTEGRNRYGCVAHPDAALFQLGSSTASVISQPAWQTVGQLLQEWRANDDKVVQTAESWVVGELRHVLQCAPDTQLALAPSGTDAHRLLLNALPSGAPLCVIVPDAAETGSGVAQSLRFGGAVQVQSYRLRDPMGQPLSIEAMQAQIEPLIEQACSSGQRVLLVQVDVSKTGLMAPAFSLVTRWRQRFADALWLAVDACQWRMPCSRIAARLAQGEAVMITGSKFMSGPSFSGALLLPARSRWQALPPELPKLGVLLRWAAALREVQDFRALPAEAVAGLLQQIGEHVSASMVDHPQFVLYPWQAGEILPNEAVAAWQGLPSIFVVGLRGQDGDLLPAQAVRVCYQAMQYSQREVPDGRMRVLLGQPVGCGVRRNGEPALALRIAIGSRMLVDAMTSAAATRLLLDNLGMALTKLAGLVSAYPDLSIH